MDLLVAAKRVRYGGSIAREGWGVQDDEIPARNQLFVRLSDRLVLEPVKDIRRLKGAFFHQGIGLGVSLGGRYGVGALVQKMDMSGAGVSGMKTKAAQETETVEDLRPGRKLGHKAIVDLLVQIEASLVAAEDVHVEAKAVEVYSERTFEGSIEEAVGIRQAFELAGSRFIAFDDGPGGEQRLESGEDEGLALVHSEG